MRGEERFGWWRHRLRNQMRHRANDLCGLAGDSRRDWRARSPAADRAHARGAGFGAGRTHSPCHRPPPFRPASASAPSYAPRLLASGAHRSPRYCRRSVAQSGYRWNTIRRGATRSHVYIATSTPSPNPPNWLPVSGRRLEEEAIRLARRRASPTLGSVGRSLCASSRAWNIPVWPSVTVWISGDWWAWAAAI